MGNVSDSNKIVLRVGGGIADFTIERVGDKIVLQEYVKIMRLGRASAGWLWECFQHVTGHYYRQQQSLEHRGKTVLSILCESGYIYIMGTNVRFNMKIEVAEKLRDSLGDLLREMDAETER